MMDAGTTFPDGSGLKTSRTAERTQMKLAGGSDNGALIPNTAIWNCSPGTAFLVRSTRLGALKPAASEPPVCPGVRGSLPLTHTSA
jgi:hypothetical protein